MQIEQTSYSSYKERILKMRERVINQPHEICIERAKLFTESYKNTKGESPILLGNNGACPLPHPQSVRPPPRP